MGTPGRGGAQDSDTCTERRSPAARRDVTRVASARAAPGEYPAPVTLLLRSERVLLGDGARGFRLVPADVLIRDGLIVSVTEPGPEGFPNEPDAVHLRHALLTPAFVNAHTHLA